MRALHQGARIRARKTRPYETQDVLVLPRGPAVGACSLHLGAARSCVSVQRESVVRCRHQLAVGVETIGGRCVELDAEEISLVSRAVVVASSATFLIAVEAISSRSSISVAIVIARVRLVIIRVLVIHAHS